MSRLNELIDWAFKNDYKIAWGNISHLTDSYSDFNQQSASGEFNDIQKRIFQSWGSFHQLKDSEMKNIILIAVSTSGKTRKIIFDCDGTKISTLLPPWYSYNEEDQCIQAIETELSTVLKKYDYTIKKLVGPYKYLSAKLGLGKYGRNNLIYIEGLGSYVRIAGFVTNAELIPHSYPEQKINNLILEKCEKCGICKKQCPTQAIGENKFLLHVDRCLSYHSELLNAGSDFDRYAEQDCLVGCLRCQETCPYNNDFIAIGDTSYVTMNQEETKYIIGEHISDHRLIDSKLKEKFDYIGLIRHRKYIIRNLRIHLTNK